MIKNLQIDGETDAGTLEELQKAIQLRESVLKQTTSQAITAMAVNVLKSLKAGTKVASEKGSNIEITYCSNLIPSWSNRGGSWKRCLRIGSTRGQHFEGDGKAIKYDCQCFAKGERYFCFYIRDIVSEEKVFDYYLVSASEKSARTWATKKRKSRINRNKGLARGVLSIATALVANRGNTDNLMSESARKWANSSLVVDQKTDGYSEGNVSIEIQDNLSYATPALKDGMTVELALKKAINSTVGQINRFHENHGVHEKITAPFQFEEMK